MQKFTANHDMPIKYVFSLGGGIKGRTIKKGEVITYGGEMNDIDKKSIWTLETLHRIESNYFKAHFTLIK